ncbi:hypothetical protein J6590_062336 [Homalodisca vitripennis]|nr:hypothetical protein J6590_062336 [Homalodisca vitripennis]
MLDKLNPLAQRFPQHRAIKSQPITSREDVTSNAFSSHGKCHKSRSPHYECVPAREGGLTQCIDGVQLYEPHCKAPGDEEATTLMHRTLTASYWDSDTVQCVPAREGGLTQCNDAVQLL